jgi:WD40 repeat protein
MCARRRVRESGGRNRSDSFLISLGKVTCASFNPNGEIIVVGSQNRTLRGYNAQTYSKLFDCLGHAGPVLCVAFHPRTEWFVSGSSDKMVHVWREGDGTLAKEAKGHRGNINGCAFDSSGQLLATAEGGGPSGRTNSIWLWNFASGNFISP